MKSALSIWWDDRIVGRLTLGEHGEMSFVYDGAWLADPDACAISRSLPLRAVPFDRRAARPFFAGLLTEETVRAQTARVLGISQGSDFALLRALGGDLAGALTLWPEGETPPTGGVATKALDDDTLVDLLDALPARPFLAGGEGLRLMLAGAQLKLPVVLVDGRVALPVPGQPTTHILKPPINRYPATTENEAFVMRLAAACCLDVAEAAPHKVKDRSYLLIRRYDRMIDAAGRVHRLHQEDFCQALGILPERKYAADGGPTFKTCFTLLREAAARPADQALKLLDAAVFNLIAGNADAHGKNFALLHAPEGTQLAPLYDLLSTAAYPALSAKPAMKMAGATALKDFNPRVWEKFAHAAELDAVALRRRARDITERVQHHAPLISAAIAAIGLDAKATASYAELVTARAGMVAASV